MRLKVHFLIYIFALLRFALRCLPSRFVLAFTSAVGEITGRLCHRDRSITLAQLHFSFPGGDPRQENAPLPGSSDRRDKELCGNASLEQFSGEAEPERLARLSLDVFRHTGECVGEVLIWERIFRTKNNSIYHKGIPDLSAASSYEYVTATGEELIRDLVRRGQGAVGLSAHFGCFELIAIYLAKHGIPVTVIGRKPNSPVFSKVLEDARRSYGVEMIWRDTAHAARKIIEAGEKKHVIAVLIDQDTNLKSGFSRFFGLEAASPVTPLELAARFRMPVFTCFITRTSRMHHHITTEQIDYRPDDPEAVQQMLDAFSQRLEDLVRAYPEQWIWWHRRWRRRPGINYKQQPELLRSTAQYVEWLREKTRQHRIASA
jgi:lauroyl/myristoyl acyltransferase